MENYRFTPYNALSLTDSRGMVFKCENGEEYKVDYSSRLSGPKILKRPGEKVFMALFFGGIPRYMENKEIEKRKGITLRKMTIGHETILEELSNHLENSFSEDIDPFDDKEILKKRRAIAEDALYDPNNLGLAEHLIRPEVGMRLASGLIILNKETQDENLKKRLRAIVSDSPISEIYCLSE